MLSDHSDSVKELNLSGLLKFHNEKLTMIPPEVFDLSLLESLDLSNNLIKEIPAEINNLKNLKTLNLSRNHIANLPSRIDFLLKLKKLDLSFNQLTSLPDDFSDLRNLEELDLHSNRLEQVPDVIMDLKELRILDIGYNEISSLPETIAELSNLIHLDIGNNQLKILPDKIVQLEKLESLLLANNSLTSVPDNINYLKSLRILDVGNNKIREIPSNIVGLKKLEQVDASHNPLENPPYEIAQRGISAIGDYFRQLKAEGEDYLYEAKLLIVGEGGAGKTTLAKKILDPEYTLDENEYSTQGIDVIHWHFSTEDDHDFQVNIWDFGGQEIYHATHQFFLTKRSFYVLVIDTRKEDTDLFYWLNVIELLSDNSPSLIIKNEKQDRGREVNERQLLGRFSHLKGILATNLANNRGLPKVVSEIKHYICQLPHIGSALPSTWVRVREALERDTRNYIGLDEYLSICEKNGFKSIHDKMQLSGYLHDLGVCLHFQEDSVLKRVVILKPKWGTSAVYKVLDNKKVIQNLGRFTQGDLAEIWNLPEYANMQDELLQLMVMFKLCYRIPDKQDEYIAPQLLSGNQPEYAWDESNNLITRYVYEFMPKGILTQFIVNMHKLIADNEKCVWRSGVVLERERARVEIIEYYDKREIKIRVSGANKKELMTIVMYELDKINDMYRRLRCNKLVPCNCLKCKGSVTPHFHSFEVLERFKADKQYLIQCMNSYNMVDVLRLLDDVVDDEQLKIQRRLDRGGGAFIGDFNVSPVTIKTESPNIQVIVQPRNPENYPSDFFREEKMDKQTGIPRKENKVISAWANGSFYLVVFVIVIASLAVLARFVSPYLLIVILITGVIFVPIIGALQLKQDKRLTDKTFIQLMKIVIGQLPLLNKFNKKQRDE